MRLNLPTPYLPFAKGGFLTPSGKCEFYSPRLEEMGLDPVPTFTAAVRIPGRRARRSPARYPLTLISSPAHQFLNSTFVNIDALRRGAREPECLLHPDDAERRGIGAGARVVVHNDRGAFTAVARVEDTIRPGVVWAPSIWWGKFAADGANANQTTSQRETDLGHGPVFYDNLVEVGWRLGPTNRSPAAGRALAQPSSSRLDCTRAAMDAGPHLLRIGESSCRRIRKHSARSSAPPTASRNGRFARSRTRCDTTCSSDSASGGPLFAGVIGYEDTVMPQIVNAVLSRHNFILLGLRGQAKSRILRALVDAPRRRDADRRRQRGQRQSVRARSRSSRGTSSPKRATTRRSPGSAATIATSKSSRRRTSRSPTSSATSTRSAPRAADTCLSDELTIHYGMLPRANRGIFALNELPGSRRQGAGRLVQRHAGRRRPDQRLPDPPSARRAALLHGEPRGLHGARQDHHAAQGSHRQRDRHALSRRRSSSGMDITRQEAWTKRDSRAVRVPDFIAELIERIAFEARNDRRIDKRSGVSQRMPITRDRERRLQRRAPRHRLGRRRHRAARVRHLRRAARDHRQDRARVRGRAGRRPGDRARAHSPRRRRARSRIARAA